MGLEAKGERILPGGGLRIEARIRLTRISRDRSSRIDGVESRLVVIRGDWLLSLARPDVSAWVCNGATCHTMLSPPEK